MKDQPQIIEQVELDELSKKTLGNYIRAAGPDRETKLKTAKYVADIGHERKGAGDHESASKHFQKAGELAGKAANRKSGINRAVDKLTKEDTAEWPVYARILEKSSRDDHYKGATKPEKMDDSLSPKEKEFAAKHGGLDGNKPEPYVDDNEIDKKNDAVVGVKKAALNKAPGSQ